MRAAGVARGDLVLDLGAGTGVLTRALVERGAEVIAVELDPTLAHGLTRRFGDVNVTVVQGDARRQAWPARVFSVFANLPFAGSTAILNHLLRDPRTPLQRAHVILQWELAAKHAALWPATLKGTYWRTWRELIVTDRVARTAFAPPPSVDAAVLRISPRPEPLVDPDLHERYWRFLSAAFETRFPLLRALRSQVSRTELRRLADTLGFSPEAHARDLDVRQWAAVFAWTRSRRR